MRICSGLFLCALVLPVVPACSDDTVACGEPAYLVADDLTTEWKWTAGELISIPLVADVDDDGLPDVVVNITRASPSDDTNADDYAVGELALLDGVTGELKWRIPHDPAHGRFGSQGRSTVAIADVDGDRVPDIIYGGRQRKGSDRSPIHAVNGAGQLLWTSHDAAGQVAAVTVKIGALAVGNLDDDANAEIVLGAAVLDHDGLLVWNQDGDGGVLGTPDDNTPFHRPLYRSGLSTLVDLDGDGKPEILSGRDAWKIAWTPGAPPSVNVTRLWRSTGGAGNDGWPAVADLDGNGTPEVVLVAWPDIRVLDGRTGAPWCGVDPSGAMCQGDPSLATPPIAIDGGNLGGPATLADFDGDSRLEAAIAGGAAIAVYDFNRPDEEVVVPDLAPRPAPGSMYVRWSHFTQDQSSAANGSAAFDFDLDGFPELLYQDECEFQIFAGATGEVLGHLQNSSTTGHEYPVVADIDADGETEILVIANRAEPITNDACALHIPDFTPRQGIFAYGPGDQVWATARRSWPQYNHHTTDLDGQGRVPTRERPHYADPLTNGFRSVPDDPDARACD